MRVKGLVNLTFLHTWVYLPAAYVDRNLKLLQRWHGLIGSSDIREVCRGPWALVSLSSGTRLLGLEMQSMSPFVYASECQLKSWAAKPKVEEEQFLFACMRMSCLGEAMQSRERIGVMLRLCKCGWKQGWLKLGCGMMFMGVQCHGLEARTRCVLQSMWSLLAHSHVLAFTFFYLSHFFCFFFFSFFSFFSFLARQN